MNDQIENHATIDNAGDRPLVTFALFAYNQEKYIREAIEGAFAQTYEPLEIILSDDCSVDKTFEIMTEMAANYRGTHCIKLNKNKKNLGISDHVRLIHEKSSGDVVIHAAGDDISLPDRAEKIVEAFTASQQAPSLVTSNVLNINERGVPCEFQPIKVIGTVLDNHGNPLKISTPINGAAVAVHRKLIEAFPPPQTGLIVEDKIMERRAMLLDGKMHIPDVLIKYRVCGEGAFNYRTKSRASYLEHLSKMQIDTDRGLDQLMVDVKHRGLSLEKFKSDIDCYRKDLFKKNELIHGSFLRSVYALVCLLISSDSIMGAKTNLFNFLLRWFPGVVSYEK